MTLQNRQRGPAETPMPGLLGFPFWAAIWGGWYGDIARALPHRGVGSKLAETPEIVLPCRARCVRQIGFDGSAAADGTVVLRSFAARFGGGFE